MAASDTSVGIAPDGGGPKVRTREVRILGDDGTIVTVEQQVVSIADDHGQFIDLNIASALADVTRELRELIFWLKLKG